MSKYENIGIAYFTNPHMENESYGKEVDGIMTSVARQIPVRKIDTNTEVTIVEKLQPQNVPCIIFTNTAGDLEHMRLDGNIQLQGITVAKVMETVEAIDRYNKTGKA